MKIKSFSKSFVNVLTPFLYVYLTLSTMIVTGLFSYLIVYGTLCNTILKNTYACSEPKNSGDDSQFMIWFFCLIVPVWILTAIFWFFTIKKMNKKAKRIISGKEEVNKKISIINLILIILALILAIIYGQLLDNGISPNFGDIMSFYIPMWIFIASIFLVISNAYYKSNIKKKS